MQVRQVAVPLVQVEPVADEQLVGDLPIAHVGFTVPDELFVGYGFDLDERYRNLPDLHVLK